MRDGVVEITSKDGKTLCVWVGTGLDETYAKLFEEASKEVRATPSRDAGVKVIVFGCFWLEALCNSRLHKFLRTVSIAKPIQESLWKALENVRIASKLDILASIEAPEHSELLKHVRGLFELRNRLGHFKEEVTEVEFTEAPALLAVRDPAFYENLPEAELVKLLKPPAIESRIGYVLETKEWLDKVEDKIVHEQQHLESGATA
jgi:hypothetical protein